MEIIHGFPLYDIYLTQAGSQYQVNALKAEISSMPDGDEKEYYQAALAMDEIGLQIKQDPANTTLSPQEINEKILAATTNLQQEMKSLRDQNPYQCTSWSLPMPTDGSDYISTFLGYVGG